MLMTLSFASTLPIPWVLIAMIILGLPMLGDNVLLYCNADIIGAGSSLASLLMKHLLSAYLFTYPDHSMNYTSLSSTRGICRLLDINTQCASTDRTTSPYNVDFALSEVSLTTNNVLNYPDAIDVPFVATAVVPVYNLPTLPSNATLTLSPDVLIRIFLKCKPSNTPTTSTCINNSIQYWNHSDIVSLNPQYENELNAAGEIIPVVRKGTSGTTIVMKSSLYALASNKTAFSLQVPVDDSDNWGEGVSSAIKKASTDLLPFVQTTASSISYINYPDAVSAGVKFASLMLHRGESNSNNLPLIANRYSSEAAIAEMGSVPILFPASSNVDLVTGLWGSQGITAWPIIGYSYLVFRSTTLRNGVTCKDRANMYEFFKWYYQDSQANAIVNTLGFSSASREIATTALEQIKSALICGDTGIKASEFVEQGSDIKTKMFYDPVSVPLEATLVSMAVAFNLQKISGSSVQSERAKSDPIQSLLQSDTVGAVAITAASNIDEKLGDKVNDFISLPFGMVAGGVMFNLCNPIDSVCNAKTIKLSLPLDVIIKIFNGQITQWSDTRITSYLSSSDAAKMPNKSIFVFNPIPSWSSNFILAMKQSSSSDSQDVSFSAGQLTPVSYDQAVSLIANTAYSIGMIPAFDKGLNFAQISFDDATVLNATAPTVDSLKQCIKHSFNEKTIRFEAYNRSIITSSDPHSCYPISVPIYATIRKKFTDNQCRIGGGIAGALYLQYMFGLQDNDFYLGMEDYYMSNGTRLKNMTDTEYTRTNKLREAREGARILMEKWNMASLVVPVVDIGTTKIRNLYMNEIEKVTCDGKSIVQNHQTLNGIPTILKQLSLATCIVCSLLIIGVATWVIKYRKARIIRNNSPIFLLQMLFGALMGVITIALFPIDDVPTFDFHIHNGIDEDINSSLDAICNSIIWLLGIGYAIMVSSLYVKMWRITKIFINPQLERFVIHDSQLVLYEAFPISVAIIELAIGQALAPQKYVRRPISYNSVDGSIVSSSGSCETDNPIVAFVPIFASIILSLIYGNYISFRSRDIPTQFSEGKWIALSLALMLVAFIFGIPVILLSSNNPIVLHFAKTVLVVIVFTVVPGFLFMPKFLIGYGFMGADDGAFKISSSSQDRLKKTNDDKPTTSDQRTMVNNGVPVIVGQVRTNGQGMEVSPSYVLELPTKGNSLPELMKMTKKTSYKIHSSNGDITKKDKTVQSTELVHVDANINDNDDDNIDEGDNNQSKLATSDEDDKERKEREKIAPWILVAPRPKGNAKASSASTSTQLNR